MDRIVALALCCALLGCTVNFDETAEEQCEYWAAVAHPYVTIEQRFALMPDWLDYAVHETLPIGEDPEPPVFDQDRDIEAIRAARADYVENCVSTEKGAS